MECDAGNYAGSRAMTQQYRLISRVPAHQEHVAALATGAVRYAPARFGDLRQVAAVQKRAFVPRLAYGYSTLLLLWLLPHVRFLVAREGDRIVGCAIGDRNGGQARVVSICVDPAVQRRGIGASLLRRLEEALPGGDVVLMVEADNTAAKALYKKEGYKDVGVSRNYYGRSKDGIWMQKQRTPNPTPKIRV
jgi:[ribosomal protein S18]-alanine N-acetyltransferase